MEEIRRKDKITNPQGFDPGEWELIPPGKDEWEIIPPAKKDKYKTGEVLPGSLVGDFAKVVGGSVAGVLSDALDVPGKVLTRIAESKYERIPANNPDLKKQQWDMYARPWEYDPQVHGQASFTQKIVNLLYDAEKEIAEGAVITPIRLGVNAMMNVQDKPFVKAAKEEARRRGVPEEEVQKIQIPGLRIPKLPDATVASDAQVVTSGLARLYGEVKGIPGKAAGGLGQAIGGGVGRVVAGADKLAPTGIKAGVRAAGEHAANIIGEGAGLSAFSALGDEDATQDAFLGRVGSGGIMGLIFGGTKAVEIPKIGRFANQILRQFGTRALGKVSNTYDPEGLKRLATSVVTGQPLDRGQVADIYHEALQSFFSHKKVNQYRIPESMKREIRSAEEKVLSFADEQKKAYKPEYEDVSKNIAGEIEGISDAVKGQATPPTPTPSTAVASAVGEVVAKGKKRGKMASQATPKSPSGMAGLLETKQMLLDVMETNRKNGRPVLPAHREKLAEIDALIRGETPEIGSVASIPVFGHPEATSVGGGKYDNLIPIKVSDAATVERYRLRAQAILDDVQGKIGKADAIANGRIRGDKRKAKEYLSSHTAFEDTFLRDILRDETLPELSRLAKMFPEQGGAQAKNIAAPATTPAQGRMAQLRRDPEDGMLKLVVEGAEGEPSRLVDSLYDIGKEPPVKKTPVVKKPNKLITEDRYKAAQDRLKQKLGTRANVGLDPTILVDLAEVGLYHLERGAKTFSAWSKKMVAEYGDGVKEYLSETWATINRDRKKNAPPDTGKTTETARAVAEAVRPQGERAVATAAQKFATRAEERGLVEPPGDLPTYQTWTYKGEQAKVENLYRGNPDRVMKIALGEETNTTGIDTGHFYTFAGKMAMERGDTDLVMRLAQSKVTATEASKGGQMGAAFRFTDENSPVTATQEVAKARRERVQKQTGKPPVDPTELEKLTSELAEVQAKLAEAEKARASGKPPEAEGRTFGGKYGSRNRIVTQDAYAEALNGWRRLMNQPIARSGIDPAAIAFATKIGTYHIEAGTRAFASWSKKMITELGDSIKPHLKDIWEKAKGEYDADVAPGKLTAQKTKLTNEAQRLQDRLDMMDFEKTRPQRVALDSEAKALRERRDSLKASVKALEGKTGEVTRAEVEAITKLAKDLNDAKLRLDSTGTQADALKWGVAKRVFDKYVSALKMGDMSLKELTKGRIEQFKTDWARYPPSAIGKLALDAAKNITNLSVSMKASWDNSFIGRQGWNLLRTHPTLWWPMMKKSWADLHSSMVKHNGAEIARDAVLAEAYSRENFRNGNYAIAKILPSFEEQYPTKGPARIPVIGSTFEASATAFENSATRARTSIFDLLYERAKKNGADVNDPVVIRNIGKVTNSLTARGELGKKGGGENLRLVLWAPKMLKAHWDVLTAHTFGTGFEGNKAQTKFVRQEAMKNLTKIALETAAIAAIANAIAPGSVETDPRSADFMKIKVADHTRFDITGGQGSVVTLLSRLLTQETKSTATGLVEKLGGSGITDRNILDVGFDFLQNKTTPMARTVIDLAKGENFQGEKPTPTNVAAGAFAPIFLENLYRNMFGQEIDKTEAAALASIADFVGIGGNTYNPLSRYAKEGGDPFVNMFKTRSVDDAMKIYDNLKPAERTQELKRILMTKITNAIGKARSDKDNERGMALQKAAQGYMRK